jgi:hypothetical protein
MDGQRREFGHNEMFEHLDIRKRVQTGWCKGVRMPKRLNVS